MFRYLLFYFVVIFYFMTIQLEIVNAAMTMKQLDQSLAMFRKQCIQKTGVDPALIDGLHRGEFPEDIPELKCFSHCVAVAAGTLNKKGDVVEAKVMKQISTVLPEQLREHATAALQVCKDVSLKYKDHCDKSFYSTKCMYEFEPKKFIYP